ncbi:response regulator, putative [Geotalea daltonii FRC-32]|uniref:Response regulator, putative n=1 Tax=Geotalea daltonii (strain DSM 22248 / JCM 15807 / FRC-32) TaxID=316067 RepID=B9M748_GEODF|nr:response regulator [Geotalea daltonii]ACM22069.1 response regulator, putative [Geotalea daltonii FRC-32]
MYEHHVMVVEDNPDDELLTLRALKKCNIRNVVVTRDGAEALDYLFSAVDADGLSVKVKPSFILLDLKLPKIDGLQCLLAIRADERTKDIPVIIVTSSKDDKDVNRCRTLRVKGYLNKPLDARELAETLQELGFQINLPSSIPAPAPRPSSLI